MTKVRIADTKEGATIKEDNVAQDEQQTMDVVVLRADGTRASATAELHLYTECISADVIHGKERSIQTSLLLGCAQHQRVGCITKRRVVA